MTQSLLFRTLLLCAAVGACAAPPGALSGSVVNEHDMGFDTVRSYIENENLVIAFERGVSVTNGTVAEGIVNQPVRILYKLDRQPIVLGAQEPFVQENGTDIVSIDHYVVAQKGESGMSEEANFAEVASGTITFTTYAPSIGSKVVAKFQCAFVDGTTLSGNFTSKMTAP